MTYFLSPRFSAAPASEVLRPSPRLFILTTSFIYLQLILGATVRHTHPTVFVVLHIINAFLVLIHVALSFGRIQRFYFSDNLMKRLGLLLGASTLVQVFLGMGSFIFTRVLEHSYAPAAGQVFFTAAHQTTGALVLATSVLLTLISILR